MWDDTRCPDLAVSLPFALMKDQDLSAIEIINIVNENPDHDPVDVMWGVYTQPFLNGYNPEKMMFDT